MCSECCSLRCICADDYDYECVHEDQEEDYERSDDESYQQNDQECKDAEDELDGVDNFDIAVKGGRESASLRAMKKVLPILRIVRNLPTSRYAAPPERK